MKLSNLPLYAICNYENLTICLNNDKQFLLLLIEKLLILAAPGLFNLIRLLTHFCDLIILGIWSDEDVVLRCFNCSILLSCGIILSMISGLKQWLILTRESSKLKVLSSMP